MKREIKFRAWDHNTDTMMIPDNFEFCDGEICWIDAGREAGPKSGNDGDPGQFEIMQYTGLKDKNGREIYEGDVVKNEYGKVMEVQYDPRSAAFGVGDYYFGTIGSGKILEVIGNIFENPELLEGKQ